jgi:hypothetical protein
LDYQASVCLSLFFLLFIYYIFWMELERPRVGKEYLFELLLNHWFEKRSATTLCGARAEKRDATNRGGQKCQKRPWGGGERPNSHVVNMLRESLHDCEDV